MSATDHNEGLRLAKIAKENDIATVLGGYHPTLASDELLSHLQVSTRGKKVLTKEKQDC